MIEFRFREPITFAELQAARQHFDAEYTNVDQQFSAQARLDVQNNSADFDKQDTGFELSSKDRSHVLILSIDKVAFSQLAPYPGWETFLARIKRDWEWFRKRIGIRHVSRVGMRYINRIDVPASTIQPVTFLNTIPNIPESIGTRLQSYSMRCQVALKEDTSRIAIITTGTISENAVPNSVALLLDIDVVDFSGLPLKQDDAWKLLESLREQKNHIFEQAITDNARELFA